MQLLPVSLGIPSWHAHSEESHPPRKISGYSEAIILKKPGVRFPTDSLSEGVLQYPKVPDT